MRKLHIVSLIFFGLTFVASGESMVTPQTPKAEKSARESDCPMMKSVGGMDMKERGDHAMGFSQEKTTHHFQLTQTGGFIQVEAKESSDTVSKNLVREHLRHIAMMFSKGDFSIPMLVHDQTPPGAVEMKQLLGALTFTFEETEAGGRVRINATSPAALSAVQKFLRFQIVEHKTGDPLEAN
jgi:hypothetical protein